MKRYGLNLDDYLDPQGYFVPNGIHWSRWNTRTRVAALLMWRNDAFPSAWSVHRTIGLMDGYYQRNDKHTVDKDHDSHNRAGEIVG